MMAVSDDQLLASLNGIKEQLGIISGTLDATIKANDERFEELERTDTRQWIVNACIVPVVAALHYVGSKFGFLKN